eukprot:comp20085_c0_seq1/m.24734 comp20085_c0_seq1/g.24734  ORF comp20085_c0_seq1/g.24734 comp20085_c0_seq1/m.24734 type:complete len:107 (-) comp20085_c0_seq1:814-1134(-)
MSAPTAQASAPTSTTTTVVVEPATEAPPAPTYQIRLATPQTEPRRVSFTNDTVDNEHMGKKKSKMCCIFKKQRAFGESSSDDSSCDEGDHSHHHHGNDYEPRKRSA